MQTKKVKLKGALQYPWLNRLDTQFNDDGELKSAVVCNLDTHKELAEAIESYLAEYQKGEGKKRNKGKAPKLHSDALPFEIDEEENTITFRTKSKVYRNKQTDEKWCFSIAFFNRENEPLGTVKMSEDEFQSSDQIPNVGSGTKAIVNCELNFWIVSGKCGASLRPRGLKIMELVEGGSEESADSHGFDDDDDDFDAPTVSNSAPEGMDGDDDEDF